MWEQIDERLKNKIIIPLWFYSAAAILILMLGFGYLISQQLDQKEQKIAKLQEQLEKQQNEITQLKMTDNQVIIKTDTVRIEQKEIVYIPVKTAETIVKHDTIINIVKVTDTVFIKEKSPLLYANNENKDELEPDANLTTARSQDSKGKNKKQRFIFLFGKPKSELPVYESERLITLKTK
ncbi:MAG: hypothetical protein P1P88_12430 [Bacteroidales bacterium]|nr:hypothetical protein [Bacteroidales bacterium]